MTRSTETSSKRVATYLNRLDAALRDFVPEEKDEILREIRAHILDSVGTASDPDAAVDRVLRLLGSPEELAARYHTESLLTRAGRSYSPWFLLHSTGRWAMLGVRGMMAFLLGLFGYTTALALTISLLLKPFMPSRVGLWVGPEGLNVGVTAHPERMHEVLGQWYIPVITVVAFAIAVGTTHALRSVVRRRRPAIA